MNPLLGQCTNTEYLSGCLLGCYILVVVVCMRAQCQLSQKALAVCIGDRLRCNAVLCVGRQR